MSMSESKPRSTRAAEFGRNAKGGAGPGAPGQGRPARGARQGAPGNGFTSHCPDTTLNSPGTGRRQQPLATSGGSIQGQAGLAAIIAEDHWGKTIKVRALYSSTRVAGAQSPFDSLTLKVYYPSRFTDSVEERSTGIVRPDASRSPFPVVILLPAEDVPQESYRWLASELAEAGMAVVTYNWINEDSSGQIRPGPGLQRKRLSRKRYGKKPSCPALPSIFGALKKLNKSSVLNDHLNLSCVVLGGHGLGGRMALLNANRDWFPAVRGAFSYGGHTLADPDQGWDKRDMLALEPDMPMLLIGATNDGVLDTETAYLAGKDAGPTWAVEQSFARGIKGKRGDRHLVLVQGASHYHFAAPRDSTIGKEFLDRRARGQGKPVRQYLAQLLVTFCDQSCRGDPMSTADLKALCDSSHPMVAHAESK